MARYRSRKKIVKYKKKGLILCEGKTEENYFNGFVKKEEYKRKFASVNVEIYKPKDHSPKGLISEAKSRIKEAKRDRDPFDFIWVVFDKDSHQNIPNAFYEAKSFRPEIKIAFTVTCFEYFILLHFKKTTKPYSKCDDVISDLKQEFPQYEKASNLFVELEPRVQTGIVNSKWTLSQCSTDLENGKMPYELSVYSNIHELLEYLINCV